MSNNNRSGDEVEDSGRRSVLKRLGSGVLAASVLGSSRVAATRSNGGSERAAPANYARRIDAKIRASHRRILRERVRSDDRPANGSDATTSNIGTKKVYLGNDTTLYPEYGNSGTESTGFRVEEISDLDAKFDKYDQENHAEVGINQGEGSATAWAYLGRALEVQDESGYQDATFTFRGDLVGGMTGDSASNYVRVKMTVEDQTDNQPYDEVVYEKSSYIGSVQEDPLTDSLRVPLEAQHVYGVKVELLAEVTAQDFTESNVVSDFHEDGSPGHGMGWSVIDLTFP